MKAFFDDEVLSRPPFSPVCSLCQHWTPGFVDQVKYKCNAFKDKPIPEEIWYGKNDHTKPYPGDNGIQFQKRVDDR